MKNFMKKNKSTKDTKEKKKSKLNIVRKEKGKKEKGIKEKGLKEKGKKEKGKKEKEQPKSVVRDEARQAEPEEENRVNRVEEHTENVKMEMDMDGFSAFGFPDNPDDESCASVFHAMDYDIDSDSDEDDDEVEEREHVQEKEQEQEQKQNDRNDTEEYSETPEYSSDKENTENTENTNDKQTDEYSGIQTVDSSNVIEDEKPIRDASSVNNVLKEKATPKTGMFCGFSFGS